MSGFGAGDRVDLSTFHDSLAEILAFTKAASHTPGTLRVTSAGHIAGLTFVVTYGTSNYARASDVTSQTFVTHT